MVTYHERGIFVSNAFLGLVSISRNLNKVYFIVRLHDSKEDRQNTFDQFSVSETLKKKKAPKVSATGLSKLPVHYCH